MSSEILVFWLIHLFIGILLPLLAYLGCCGLNDPSDERHLSSRR